MQTKDLVFVVSDIETPREMFLFGGKILSTGEIFKFKITRWQNDLYAMVKFIESHPEMWYVGFNYLAFDSQVIEWIIRNYEKWDDKTNLQICEMIALRGGDAIDDQKYDIQPRIRVDQLSFNIIDLYKVHHFDNEANRCGLKWLEIMMDVPNVEEMPIHHTRTDLTREECDMIEEYWINDLVATETFLQITLGNTDLELYKGKNMLQERLDAATRYKFRTREVLNWSDTKMGEQINLLYFCNLKKIKPEDVYEMKRNRKATRPFTFGKCIPDYVTFKTREFQRFSEEMKKERVRLDKKKIEYTFRYNGTTYTIAKGGIHSVDAKRNIIVPPGSKLVDIDLGSQYPGTLIRRLLYPKHLGVEWVQNVLERMTERIACKRTGKKEKDLAIKAEMEGRAETLKKVLNAGTYGMTGQVDSWQYDPFVMYSCTIGNQFEMLMLIETLELNGIHCVSANTDGLTVFYPEELDALFHQLCDEWEKIIKLPVVDGEMQGRLEYTEYEGLVQEHVNCYIAFKKDSKPKVKGRFQHQVLLNKNNTKDITRIQRIAIQEYFSKGIAVEKTIKEATNIMLFIFGYKSRDYTFLLQKKGKERQDIGHLVRCYASTSEDRLIKSKDDDGAEGVDELRIIKDSGVTVYNKHIKLITSARKINYDWYIEKTKEVIRGIEAAKFTGGKKIKKYIAPPKEQTSLF